MKLPRNVFGQDVVNGLQRVGCAPVRPKGDHVYLTTANNGEHHIAVPLHRPTKVGTLAAILSAVADHPSLERDELLRRMKL